MQREKLTRSGRLLEVDFYPIWNDGRRVPIRAPKSKPSTKEQEKYNFQKVIKEFVRKINANFDTGDLWLHPTYEPQKAPQTEVEARRNISNYIRRIKTKRKSELKRVLKLLERNPTDERLNAQRKKLEAPFKYAGVIHRQTYKSGPLKGRCNWHFHIFMTGGIERDVLEDMWGMRINVDRFRPEVFGPEAAAKYMLKSIANSKNKDDLSKGAHRFFCSKNLKKSKVSKPKDGKITKRGVEKLATQRIDDSAYWEKRYKGYRFLRGYARYNDYNGNWYVSVVMYKADVNIELPKWGFDEWLLE